MAIAAGLWIGGKVPVVFVQNTGFFESGDSVRGICLDADIPLVMMIGYRGYTRHGKTTDSAAKFIEPILHNWQINYCLWANKLNRPSFYLSKVHTQDFVPLDDGFQTPMEQGHIEFARQFIDMDNIVKERIWTKLSLNPDTSLS